MATRHLSYKGKEILITQLDDEHAEIEIDGEYCDMSLHPGPLPMWSCDEAFFASPDQDEVVRHLVDYWYIISSPNTAPPVGGGHHHGTDEAAHAHAPPGHDHTKGGKGARGKARPRKR